jgi:hypothetical protein
MPRINTSIFILFFMTFQAFTSNPVEERWDVFELLLKGPSTGNPYRDVVLTAQFENGEDTMEVKGFYNGEGNYLIRFSPNATGTWRYQTQSNNRKLITRGSFECIEPSGINKGPVTVTDTFYLQYATGVRFHPIGTTTYRWLEMDKSIRDQTIESLRDLPFNKTRFKIIGPTAGGNNPVIPPFEKKPDGTFDFYRPNPLYFEVIDYELKRLMDLGIEADMIFLHPYDRITINLDWMDMEQTMFYLDYIIARFAAYRNVWWGTNEFDLMESKTMEDWDTIFKHLMNNDPYNRLRSNHNAAVFYDHNKPWITHASIQGESWWMAPVMRERYHKPIIYDEFCYEGFGEDRTMSLNGDVLTHRFWLMTVNGVFASHGDATVNPETGLRFFSQGGTPSGTSHIQLHTLKRILDEAPGNLKPMGHDWRLSNILAGVEDEYFVYYLGEYQNKLWVFYELPENIEYKAEIIDTRTGKFYTVDETIRKNSRLILPGNSYMAIRLRKL